MIVERLVVGTIAANCFIIGDEETKKGAIIDPGGDPEKILRVVEKLGLDISFIIVTHGHFDHNAGMKGLKENLDCDFLLHKEDLSFVRESKESARRWGIDINQVPDPDGNLDEGDVLELGSLKLAILHTPGHSPGGISIYIESEKAVFCGDTLFQGSIGRTDFRMGSLEVLSKSIRARLYTLPDETIVYTGHGPTTTIGVEKVHNLFVRA